LSPHLNEYRMLFLIHAQSDKQHVSIFILVINQLDAQISFVLQ